MFVGSKKTHDDNRLRSTIIDENGDMRSVYTDEMLKGLFIEVFNKKM